MSSALISERDAYDALARYYDASYAKLRATDDVAFYRDLALASRGPVLELGVGTGRVLLPIAERGIPVTGVDCSPRMLQQLRAKRFPPTLRLLCAPMQDFDLGEDRFTLIYAAFRSFQHLLEVEDQLRCLACVRRHLAPGGTFAFDVFAPRFDLLAKSSQPEVEEARFELDGDTVVRRVGVSTDPALQRLHVALRHERSRAGELVANESVTLTLRYFFRYELEHVLARAGFSAELYGGFDRRPFDHLSSETVVVARATQPAEE
jgi:SAM-dependent methyltransferase